MPAYLIPQDSPDQIIRIEDQLLIGRHEPAFEALMTHDRQVSRRHAKVGTDGKNVLIEDLASQNGTFVNGIKIDRIVRLSDGDRIRIGACELTLRLELDDDSATILAVGRMEGARSALGLGPNDADPGDTDRLRILYKISEQISRIRSLDALLDDILEQIFEAMPVGRGAILLKGRDGNFNVRAYRSTDTLETGAIQVSRSVLEYVLEHEEAILTPRADQETRFEMGASVQIDLVQSVACVPMIIERQDSRQVVGILQVMSGKDREALRQEDLELLLGVGSAAAVAIENSRLYTELNQRLNQLELVNSLERALNEAGSFESFIRTCLVRARETLNADAAFIALEEGNGTRRVLVEPTREQPTAHVTDPKGGESGAQEGTAEVPQETLPESDLQATELLTEGLIQALDDQSVYLPGQDGVSREVLKSATEHFGRTFKSLVVVGLRSGEEIDGVGTSDLGVLALFSEASSAFPESNRTIYQILGFQVKAAIVRKRLSEEREAHERLATVGRLASTVVHDFKAPLSLVHGFAQLSKSPHLDPGRRDEYLDLIQVQSMRCVNMAHDMLEYAKGNRQWNFARVHTRMFFDEMNRLLTDEMERNGVAFTLEDLHDGEVRMDPDRMQRVLLNLSSNSLRVLTHGDAFSISCRGIDDWLEIRVSDTGPGVPPEIHDSLFEPFVSFGKSKSTGLGLSIAREILTHHGGSIDLDTDVEEGVCFVIRIPLSVAQARS